MRDGRWWGAWCAPRVVVSGHVGTATAGTRCVTSGCGCRTARAVLVGTVGASAVTVGPFARELCACVTESDSHALTAPPPTCVAQLSDRCCGPSRWNRATPLTTLRHPRQPERRRRRILGVTLPYEAVSGPGHELATVASSGHEPRTQTGTGPVQQLGRALLNIGRMGPGRADYYLTAVARSDGGVEGYYLARGEEPGRWLGTGSKILGLAGEVTGEQLRAVLDAKHPATGDRLSAHPARKVPGFDHTFRAPKSVSLLWALGDRDTA
ncbi:MAG: hypothetical protein EA388_06360, partial [Nitriliruptor sp.]